MDVLSSSGSSSSSDGSPAARKPKKAPKKSKRKSKKAEKKSKKSEKRRRRSLSWKCDRIEAVRLITQLLHFDPRVAEELKAVFKQVDDGDVVHLEGLEDKQARKKLRHLLQALKLAPAGEKGFRTATKKVSFSDIFHECLEKALHTAAAPAAAPTVQQTNADKCGQNAETMQKQCRKMQKQCRQMQIDTTVPGGAPAAALVAGAAAAGPEGLLRAERAPQETLLPEEEKVPQRQRALGPQLPVPGVGGGDVAEGQQQDSSGSEDGDEQQQQQMAVGPRQSGEERRGVDLNDLPSCSKREDWMTTPHASMAAAFASEGGGRSARSEKFEVRRSKEEQAEFERMYAQRGASLLQEQREQKFAGHEDEMERVRKRKHMMPDIWGMTARQQEQGTNTAGDESSSKAQRRAFDPERDLQSTRPISGEDFSKLVETSVTDLAGRFSRGHVTTSFL